MKIARDKQLHFYAGVLISILSIVVSVFFTQNIIILMSIAMFFTTLGGGAKELIYDKYIVRGIPDWWDFWWTIFGGIAVCLLILIKVILM